MTRSAEDEVGALVVARQQGILAIQCQPADRLLDRVGIDLDVPIVPSSRKSTRPFQWSNGAVRSRSPRPARAAGDGAQTLVE